MSNNITKTIKEIAHETILECKDKCYSTGRKAGNVSEGDYGDRHRDSRMYVLFYYDYFG